MSYSITTDSFAAGGARNTSTSYTNDGNVGGVGGIATASAPAETLKAGYVGQLTEVSTVQLAATPATVNEAATLQLAATATLDDATTVVLLGGDLNWSVVSGPITSINASGLATATNVYQDTAATVQGSYRGVSGTLGLTIVNVGTDDLGLYASDSLPDAWQVQYFGQNNPLAAPTADASGTGQNNLLKYTAGLIPTDRNSRLLTSVGGSGTHTITINPRLSDRTYTVQFSTTLSAGSWQTLSGATIQDNGQTRTVTDPDAVSTRKFYRVQVSYP
ncbi:MAG: hypothetical protein ACKVY0_17015 [Prosthecobacter sp.]|uniref:hypothetical protein n=1 Tax=Prosthecobacter sp. TaxID=1965333 RepID=UPI0039044788